ncbi:Por secretion system C-terminal sorting domain-containing protein [Flavobacterium fluvii]|uniref:Por secretion system C-terminal sorting domain-containing protein n=1 Tax=Flavobacterium fluvii TaxID=468056 RepID=A0A1M5FF28_9FLAO|nr:T9SS type A sorting domain-containing protein [Flavobacterium fluvii]SHF90049.1 Por secretion system C-terminal sorting domain-containing protein [Flavobacterium fluvii]
MKKISKFGIMLGVTLLTMNLYAGTAEFTLDVKKEQGKKMVTFALNKMNKIDLSIYDAEGKLINFEKVDSQKNINRTYDLRALPEGTYFLEAESDMKISRYEISVVGETASLSANPISEIYKPTFVNKKGLIQLTFLNLDKSPVNIKVYDKANNEVYDSDVILDQDVKKVFDINKINDEEYTFVMTYKDKSYSKTFASN